MPFLLNNNKECLFLLNNGPAKQFVFTNHIIKLMGSNYFHLKHVRNTKFSDSLLKKGLVKECALLATKIEGANQFCYTDVSNNWLTLNNSGAFRVINEFNHKK